MSYRQLSSHHCSLGIHLPIDPMSRTRFKSLTLNIAERPLSVFLYLQQAHLSKKVCSMFAVISGCLQTPPPRNDKSTGVSSGEF